MTTVLCDIPLKCHVTKCCYHGRCTYMYVCRYLGHVHVYVCMYVCTSVDCMKAIFLLVCLAVGTMRARMSYLTDLMHLSSSPTSLSSLISLSSTLSLLSLLSLSPLSLLLSLLLPLSPLLSLFSPWQQDNFGANYCKDIGPELVGMYKSLMLVGFRVPLWWASG